MQGALPWLITGLDVEVGGGAGDDVACLCGAGHRDFTRRTRGFLLPFSSSFFVDNGRRDQDVGPWRLLASDPAQSRYLVWKLLESSLP